MKTLAKKRIGKTRRVKNVKRTSNVKETNELPNVDTSKSKKKKRIKKI